MNNTKTRDETPPPFDSNLNCMAKVYKSSEKKQSGKGSFMTKAGSGECAEEATCLSFRTKMISNLHVLTTRPDLPACLGLVKLNLVVGLEG